MWLGSYEFLYSEPTVGIHFAVLSPTSPGLKLQHERHYTLFILFVDNIEIHYFTP